MRITPRTSLLFLIGGLGLVLSIGCTPSHPELHSEPNIEPLQDMLDQPAVKPQHFNPSTPETAASRLPPEGTVPVGYKPYPYHNDPITGAKKNINPLAGQMTSEVLDLGRRNFETFCAVCHGYQARGDGPVSVKMPMKPPPLVSEKIMKVSDGAIFHIISDGQGLMSSYAYQLIHERDRWAIVNYIRSLQKLAKSGAQSPESK